MKTFSIYLMLFIFNQKQFSLRFWYFLFVSLQVGQNADVRIYDGFIDSAFY